MPDTKVTIVAPTCEPLRDVKGLLLTPDLSIADAPLFDVLHVAGGLGQQALMEDEVRRHAEAGMLIFSVCTGALLCGAAGLLRGRAVTTHWATHELLSCYGADPVHARVVVDGLLVSAAGVTAGLDGALLVACLLRGRQVAEEIQLGIEYAPAPLFRSGTPDQASGEVLESFRRSYEKDRLIREEQAQRFRDQ